MDEDISFRPAERADVPEIARLIRALAAFLGEEDEAQVEDAQLCAHLFEQGSAEAVIVEHRRKGAIGFALFYPTFSTWTGKRGMFLEDLFLEEEYRRDGVGAALMSHLAHICQDRGWARLEWTCLAKNTSGLAFYRSLGAQRMDDVVVHRFDAISLERLAKEV